MAYKNIDIKELGLRQRIVFKASRVAFFVPRLLSKLAKKVIANPITKLVTGVSYDTVKAGATNIAMQAQNDMADGLQSKIDEGKQNLEDWKNDPEYLIGNMAKYKAYDSTIRHLEKKQARLRRSPKKLLVARTYFEAMKQYRNTHKASKQTAKMVKEVVQEYQSRVSMMESKKQEIEALSAALAQAQKDFGTMQTEFDTFKEENREVLEHVEEPVESRKPVVDPVEHTEEPVTPVAEEFEPAAAPAETPSETTIPTAGPDVTEQDLMDQMGDFASQAFAAPSDDQTLGEFGLDSGKTK